MKDLLKEMSDRLAHLESLKFTDENKWRIKELTLCIVKVQQILLKDLKK